MLTKSIDERTIAHVRIIIIALRSMNNLRYSKRGDHIGSDLEGCINEDIIHEPASQDA